MQNADREASGNRHTSVTESWATRFCVFRKYMMRQEKLAVSSPSPDVAAHCLPAGQRRILPYFITCKSLQYE